MYARYRNESRVWESVFEMSNLTNRTGLFNFQTVFEDRWAVARPVLHAKSRFYWWGFRPSTEVEPAPLLS